MAPRRGTSDEVIAGRSPPRLALASVGSPENAFADAGRILPLQGLQRVVFGRHAAAHDEFVARREGEQLRVEIPLPYVSGDHAELRVVPTTGVPGHRLVDHGSRNGTHLEGTRVEGEMAVMCGDIFEIGRSFWTLIDLPEHDDEAAIRRIEPAGVVNSRMRTLLSVLARLADVSIPLLFTGETGVGKDRLAMAVHRASGATGEFVHANVITSAVEQLLVGSPADPSTMQRAAGGSLYLDEVGELDSDAQTKLQSALMSHAPATWTERAESDVRVIAASTRNLRSMVARQDFRPDLMARLAGFEASVPPLRERREDFGLLLRDMARRPDGSPVALSSSVFRSMLSQEWPFNVRELEHAVAATVAMAGDSPRGITFAMWRAVSNRTQSEPRDPGRIQAVREALVQHLVAHQGDTSAVAHSMHCDLDDVERWLTRFNLRAEEYSRVG